MLHDMKFCDNNLNATFLNMGASHWSRDDGLSQSNMPISTMDNAQIGRLMCHKRTIIRCTWPSTKLRKRDGGRLPRFFCASDKDRSIYCSSYDVHIGE